MLQFCYLSKFWVARKAKDRNKYLLKKIGLWAIIILILWPSGYSVFAQARKLEHEIKYLPEKACLFFSSIPYLEKTVFLSPNFHQKDISLYVSLMEVIKIGTSNFVGDKNEIYF